MILHRQGNKKKLSKEIVSFFPEHKVYVEYFFGAGGLFFNKPKAHINILNDLDSDIFNFWKVLQDQKEAFIKEVEGFIVSDDIFKYYRENEAITPIQKAIRFLYLANYSLYGSGGSLKSESLNQRNIILERIDDTYKFIQEKTIFLNKSYEKVIPSVGQRIFKNKDQVFIYADPPYVNTSQKYNTPRWKPEDFSKLVRNLLDTGFKFAISEFDDPFVLETIKKKDLNIKMSLERVNIKNRRTEILITNY